MTLLGFAPEQDLRYACIHRLLVRTSLRASRKSYMVQVHPHCALLKAPSSTSWSRNLSQMGCQALASMMLWHLALPHCMASPLLYSLHLCNHLPRSFAKLAWLLQAFVWRLLCCACLSDQANEDLPSVESLHMQRFVSCISWLTFSPALHLLLRSQYAMQLHTVCKMRESTRGVTIVHTIGWQQKAHSTRACRPTPCLHWLANLCCSQEPPTITFASPKTSNQLA